MISLQKFVQFVLFNLGGLYQSLLACAPHILHKLTVAVVLGRRFYNPLNTLICAATLRPNAWSE